MTRGLYGWKPPSAARDYFKEQDLRDAAERAAIASNQRMQESRDWLSGYRSQTRFNWSGRFLTITITEKDDEENKTTEPAQATEVSVEEGVADAAGQKEGGAPEDRRGSIEDPAVVEPVDVRGLEREPSYIEPPF